MALHEYGGDHLQLDSDDLAVRQRLVRRAGCVVLVSAWALLTAARAQDWTSEQRLWLSAVQEAPSKPRPLINFANTLVRTSPDLAATYYEDAIALTQQPGRTKAERTVGRAIARANMALLLADAGELELGAVVMGDIFSQHPVDVVLNAQQWLQRRASDSH